MRLRYWQRIKLIARHFRWFDASPPVAIPSCAAFPIEQMFARPLLSHGIKPEKNKIFVTVVFVGSVRCV